MIHLKCHEFKDASADYMSMMKMRPLGEMETCLLPGYRSWILLDQDDPESARGQPSTELKSTEQLSAPPMTQSQKADALSNPNKEIEAAVSVDNQICRKIERRWAIPSTPEPDLTPTP